MESNSSSNGDVSYWHFMYVVLLAFIFLLLRFFSSTHTSFVSLFPILFYGCSSKLRVISFEEQGHGCSSKPRVISFQEQVIKKGDGLYIVNVSEVEAAEVEASAVMQHALKIHANLPLKLPTFICLITKFIRERRYLIIPLEICKSYMKNAGKIKRPNRLIIMEDITFEDECGKEWHTESIVLVQPIKFKVYIVRQNDLVKPDRTGLRNPDDVAAEEANSGIPSFEEVNEEYLFLDSFIDIKKFQIVFNGSCIDSKLSQDCKVKYYELCCSRRSYLHCNLSNCIRPTLASEIVMKMTSIAEKIKGIKVCPTQ